MLRNVSSLTARRSSIWHAPFSREDRAGTSEPTRGRKNRDLYDDAALFSSSPLPLPTSTHPIVRAGRRAAAAAALARAVRVAHGFVASDQGRFGWWRKSCQTKVQLYCFVFSLLLCCLGSQVFVGPLFLFYIFPRLSRRRGASVHRGPRPRRRRARRSSRSRASPRGHFPSSRRIGILRLLRLRRRPRQAALLLPSSCLSARAPPRRHLDRRRHPVHHGSRPDQARQPTGPPRARHGRSDAASSEFGRVVGAAGRATLPLLVVPAAATALFLLSLSRPPPLSPRPAAAPRTSTPSARPRTSWRASAAAAGEGGRAPRRHVPRRGTRRASRMTPRAARARSRRRFPRCFRLRSCPSTRAPRRPAAAPGPPASRRGPLPG